MAHSLCSAFGPAFMTPTDHTPPPSSSEPRPRRRRLHASRGRSARDLLRPTQFQESLLLAPPPSLQNTAIAGLQAAITVLIAVAAMHFSPWDHMVGFPALGALAALFGRFASMRRRRGIVAICAVLFVMTLLVLLRPLWKFLIQARLKRVSEGQSSSRPTV